MQQQSARASSLHSYCGASSRSQSRTPLLPFTFSPLQWQHVDISQPLDKKEFGATLHRYPLVVVNFYAPWCPFCRRMEPSWEAATKAVHDKYPEETDGRIRFAKVRVARVRRLQVVADALCAVGWGMDCCMWKDIVGVSGVASSCHGMLGMQTLSAPIAAAAEPA